METRAHFILIGTFTLSLMVAAAVFVLWLGKYTDQEFAYYDVVFKEPVTGLSEGGAVQYNGIQVGEVAGLRLDPLNPAHVLARVRVVAGTPIKRDTRAQLGFMGVTGVALIQLSGGTPGSEALRPDSGQEVGTIIADTSSLQRIIEGGGDVFANVNELLLRLNRVFADENIARFSAALSHVETVSASVADESEALRQMLRDGAKAAANLERVLARVDSFSGNVESLVQGVDRAVNSHLDQIMTEARTSAEELRQFSTQLGQLMQRTQPHVERFSSEGLEQISATLGQLARLSQHLERIAQRLEDSPAEFLFNGDAVKEYQPDS